MEELLLLRKKIRRNQFSVYSGVTTERLTTKQIKNTINSIHSQKKNDQRMNEKEEQKCSLATISHLLSLVCMFYFQLYCVRDSLCFR